MTKYQRGCEDTKHWLNHWVRGGSQNACFWVSIPYFTTFRGESGNSHDFLPQGGIVGRQSPFSGTLGLLLRHSALPEAVMGLPRERPDSPPSRPSHQGPAHSPGPLEETEGRHIVRGFEQHRFGVAFVKDAEAVQLHGASSSGRRLDPRPTHGSAATVLQNSRRRLLTGPRRLLPPSLVAYFRFRSRVALKALPRTEVRVRACAHLRGRSRLVCRGRCQEHRALPAWQCFGVCSLPGCRVDPGWRS